MKIHRLIHLQTTRKGGENDTDTNSAKKNSQLLFFKMLKKQMRTSDRSADAVLVGMVKSSRVKLGNNCTRVLSRF